MSSVFAQRRQKLLSLKALRGSSPAPAHTEEACPAWSWWATAMSAPCAGTTTPWGPITA